MTQARATARTAHLVASGPGGRAFKSTPIGFDAGVGAVGIVSNRFPSDLTSQNG
ncbi:MAG TPA: hypothetical protein VH740_19340 [Vicinamibacterales bacterium]